MKFTVIVVSLNAGKELLNTVDSIIHQTYKNIEIIVKDGCSTDGSIELLPKNEKIHLVSKKDKSIYDAMNQAIDYATGDFVLFLNCGDVFYDDGVLETCNKNILKCNEKKLTIFYGDCYTANRNSFLRYPEFTDYVCFTKVLCHQATIYPLELLKLRKFNLKYRMAADYEYYVNAYKNGVALIHLPVVVVDYQGNGTSETKFNRCLALEERKSILKENYSVGEYRKIWLKTQMRGSGIKQVLVKQEWFYPCYKKVAELYYKVKNLTK